LGKPFVHLGQELDWERAALYETFKRCSSLTELDLSSFDTKNVETIAAMLYECHNLKTVYVSDLWDLQGVTNLTSNNMFLNCTSLVGEEGTAYDASNISPTYARIDGGVNAPGYFTHIRNKEDAVLVKSSSLYRIGKNLRKVLNSTDKYKPSEMGSVVGGLTPKAVKGTFTPEADMEVISFDNLPFKPSSYVIACKELYTEIVDSAVICTSHINGVTGDIVWWIDANTQGFGTLDPVDYSVTGYGENSLTIAYTGWGMVFKAGYTYDYIISGGFEK
jgi:surface protein